MPGFYTAYDFGAADVGPDQLDGPFDLVSSANTQALAMYRGDPLLLTTVDGSVPRLRKVIQDDIDDLWQVSSSNTGFMGICPQDVATDSSGFSTTVPAAVSLFGGVKNVYPVISMASYGPADLVTGRLRSSVISLRNLIGGVLWENTTIDDTLIGTMVGMLISTISGQPPTFFWSTAAATKIARIQTVDDQNPLFNVAVTANSQNTTHNPRCPLAVSVLPAFRQIDTANNWDD